MGLLNHIPLFQMKKDADRNNNSKANENIEDITNLIKHRLSSKRICVIEKDKSEANILFKAET